MRAQVLQANVQRGSRVYERGHLLVLAWADAQRDQEVIWKILSQVRGCCRWMGGRRFSQPLRVLQTASRVTLAVSRPDLSKLAASNQRRPSHCSFCFRSCLSRAYQQ